MEQSIVATAIVIMEVMNKKNGILQCMETLKPISHWLMPDSTKSFINKRNLQVAHERQRYKVLYLREKICK